MSELNAINLNYLQSGSNQQAYTTTQIIWNRLESLEIKLGRLIERIEALEQNMKGHNSLVKIRYKRELDEVLEQETGFKRPYE